MEDKLEKVIAEIKRLRTILEEKTRNLYDCDEMLYGEKVAYNKLLSFIYSMPETQVWHDGKKEPEDKSKAVVCQLGDKTQSVITMEYNKRDKNFYIKGPLGCEYLVGLDWPGIRWAYPDDLFPTK